MSTKKETQLQSNSEIEPLTLKFRAIKDKLDWKGNVIEDVIEKDYIWYDYDPEKFFDSALCNGDLKDVPSPFGERSYACDAFMKLFSNDKYNGYNGWDILCKYKSVESISFNGNKFVIYRRCDEHKNMYWTIEE